MRGQRLAVAVFLAALGIAGAWMLTEAPDAGQTVRVEAPVSPPTAAPPPASLTIEDLIRQATGDLASRPLCEAPPNEVPEEFKREVEKALATAPLPPTVPGDETAGVINVHRRVVTC